MGPDNASLVGRRETAGSTLAPWVQEKYFSNEAVRNRADAAFFSGNPGTCRCATAQRRALQSRPQTSATVNPVYTSRAGVYHSADSGDGTSMQPVSPDREALQKQLPRDIFLAHANPKRPVAINLLGIARWAPL